MATTTKIDTSKGKPNEGKKPETGTPMGPGTSEAPLIIKTNEMLKDANVDPRGDNRPGVIPDQPLQEGIDPVTNLREDLVDKETLTPLPVSAQPGGILNPPVLESVAPKAEEKTKSASPKAGTMRMILESDYWPLNKPDDWSDEDKENKEYRVNRGTEIDLPNEEAMRLLDLHLARRADPRA